VHAKLAAGGRQWAYTTVLTLLQRLEAKGYAASEKAGLALVFRAIVSRDGLLRRRLREIAAELTDGAATPLVEALVEERFTEDEIAGFRRLLDEVEKRGRKRRRKDRGPPRRDADRAD